MGWPWAIVNLDASQVAYRRTLLDSYANIAQISVVVPLLALQALRSLEWLHNRAHLKAQLDAPSSPAAKHARSASLLNRLSSVYRKAIWWLGDDVVLFRQQLGSRGELIGGAIWAFWLLLLTVLQTQGDYLHLTKRFGIVAASQLPFHYLLAIKTPYSPLQLLTRSSHETLNSIHQILGRVITVFFYAHAILYVNFYVIAGLLEAKLQEAYVICGIVGVVLFTLIGTSSLGPVRRWSYRLFLALHIMLSVLLLPILWYHVHHIRIYIYETVVIVVANLVLRAIAAKTCVDARFSIVQDAQLVEIRIPLSSSYKSRLWQAGQHFYISLPGQGLRSVLARNPFTLASLPSVDKELRFVARILAGNTSALAAVVRRSIEPRTIVLEGPYGLTTHGERLLAYDRVLFVAGGIGGTFISPLYRELLTDLSPGKGGHRRQKVTAVWVARTVADVEWALPDTLQEREGYLERLTVYLTQQVNDTSVPNGLRQPKSAQKTAQLAEDNEGIELEEQTQLLKDDEASSKGASHGLSGLSTVTGRPDIPRLVDQVFAGGSSERVAIVVCGPASLGRVVRKAVTPYVYKGREVWFWDESFSL